MQFLVLGELQVRVGGVPQRLRRTKPKVVLGVLLANANQPVSAERIIEELWAAAPPSSATANLYTYVCAVRQLVGADGRHRRLTCGPAGYTLRVEDGELDAASQLRLAADGRGAVRGGNVAAGERLLGQAVRLWRGRPLSDLPPTPELERWAGCLEEQHRALARDWTDARLLLGRGDELVWELRAALAADPVCERLHGQLMLALYRAGRVGEALAAFGEASRVLAEELGLDPGRALTGMRDAMLRRDPSLTPAALTDWLAAGA
jgi:DNA-binding SARP family transcriptional activator